MKETEFIVNPPDLMGDSVCECGADKWIVVGCTNHQTIYECVECGNIVYGCD